MALIKFTVNPGPPAKVDTGGVLDLHPGDRLLFVQPAPAAGGDPPPVYVDLDTTLVALVKTKGPPAFTAVAQADGSIIVTLLGGGNPPEIDPP